jgi:hypothetical protein
MAHIDRLHLDVHRRYQEKLSTLRATYGASPVVAAWDKDTKRFLELANII